MNDKEKILFDQNADAGDRLSALSSLGVPEIQRGGEWVNNHIHTTYSFSPYTPSAAVYCARKAGLSTAGIMDHDSVGGISEFIAAGEIISMPVTVGFECRTDVSGTPLEGKKLNNPDQNSVAYVTMHGIPHQNIAECEKVLSPLREKRNMRNRKMCANINEICRHIGVYVDFDKDVLPLSMYDRGGSVTERHVLFALTKKLVGGDRNEDIKRIGTLCGTIAQKTAEKLLSAPQEYYLYDVLGVLKSSLVGRIYVDADEELMHITDFCKLAHRVGGICAYAYLGDVGESPTGDKAAQKFEDSYLDILMPALKDFGFDAVTYMPSRNTKEQLSRIMRLCDEYGFFQISGEDINSPRQSFVCEAMAQYRHLYDATYALIGHERLASIDAANGMFSENTLASMPSLSDRIRYFAEAGREVLHKKI